MRSLSIGLIFGIASATTMVAAPLPIDPLWKSESFRRVVTGSFGIDSRTEPIITTDEEHYIRKSAEEMGQDNRKAAIETLSTASILDRSPAMMFNLATLQFEEDLKEEAEATFRKVLEAFPNFRDAHRNLAIILVQAAKYDEAEKHLLRAYELGANDGLTMGLLGYCHATRDHHQAALDAYRLAALSQPKERQWSLGMAQALQALGQPRLASEVFKKLIDENPVELHPWLAQADAFIDLGEQQKAASNLEWVYRTGTLGSQSVLSLGHLYLNEALPDLAVERYLSAIEAEMPPSLHNAIEALNQLVIRGHIPQSQRLVAGLQQNTTYQPLFTAEDTDKKILSLWHRSQAVIETEAGEKEKGAALLTTWLEREPNDGQALILLSRIRYEEGQREEAEMLLEHAQKLDDTAADAYVEHARLLVSELDYPKAVERLELAQKIQHRDNVADYLQAIRELIP